MRTARPPGERWSTAYRAARGLEPDREGREYWSREVAEGLPLDALLGALAGGEPPDAARRDVISAIEAASSSL